MLDRSSLDCCWIFVASNTAKCLQNGIRYVRMSSKWRKTVFSIFWLFTPLYRRFRLPHICQTIDLEEIYRLVSNILNFKACGSVFGSFLCFTEEYRRSVIENLSKIYRTSIEHLSNIYRTSIEHVSKIYRTSIFVYLGCIWVYLGCILGMDFRVGGVLHHQSRPPIHRLTRPKPK